MHHEGHHLIEKHEALLPTFENKRYSESEIDTGGVDEDEEG